MRWLASAVYMALLTWADVTLREGELRRAMAELILREVSGLPVKLNESVELSWRLFVPTAIFTSFFLQLAVYGAWNAAFRLGGCKWGLAASLTVLAALATVLWLFVLRAVFYMGVPLEQPLMYLLLNSVLAFVKHWECKEARYSA